MKYFLRLIRKRQLDRVNKYYKRVVDKLAKVDVEDHFKFADGAQKIVKALGELSSTQGEL